MIVYVFMVQRPSDKEPWPVVFKDRKQAEGYPFRASNVLAVPLMVYDEPINTEDKPLTNKGFDPTRWDGPTHICVDNKIHIGAKERCDRCEAET